MMSSMKDALGRLYQDILLSSKGSGSGVARLMGSGVGICFKVSIWIILTVAFVAGFVAVIGGVAAVTFDFVFGLFGIVDGCQS